MHTCNYLYFLAFRIPFNFSSYLPSFEKEKLYFSMYNILPVGLSLVAGK